MMTRDEHYYFDLLEEANTSFSILVSLLRNRGILNDDTVWKRLNDLSSILTEREINVVAREVIDD